MKAASVLGGKLGLALELAAAGAGRADVTVAAAEALPAGLAFPPPMAITTMMSSRTKAPARTPAILRGLFFARFVPLPGDG